jgi:5-methylcytosine-specific restriction endonuclease McrA
MTSTAATTFGDLDSPAEVLRFARERRAAAERAEADVLLAAALWAEQHPPESIQDTATWLAPGAGDTGLPLAGEGAPLVAEFCLAELALALGVSTDSGRNLVADAVELKYRLPRTWARIHAGDLPAWRGRRIAQATLGLTRAAAAHVDAQVAGFAHKIGPAALDRLVAEAIARHMPDRARENAAKAAEGRHFSIHHDQVSFHGTSRIEGELDLADALDLDAALAREAQVLKNLGSADSLDVRRSIAAGELARHQLALDLNAGGSTTTAGSTAAEGVSTGSTTGGGPTTADGSTTGGGSTTVARRRVLRARQVVLHVHLAQAAITGTTGTTGQGGCGDLDLARVENHRQVVTADQVRDWCANPDTAVTVKPIIDLNDHLHVEGYEIPDRLADQVAERDHTCVFPWCTRPATRPDTEPGTDADGRSRRQPRADVDHVIAYDDGGATASDNLAPLCRRHHRLKTHSPWTYTMLEPGAYLWSSPHGYQFLRDTEGTLDVSPDRRTSPPPPRTGGTRPPEH